MPEGPGGRQLYTVYGHSRPAAGLFLMRLYENVFSGFSIPLFPLKSTIILQQLCT